MSPAVDDPDEIQALAGEYVLGLLDAAEAREIEQRMTQDMALRDAIAGWRDRMVEIDTAAEPIAPTVSLWQRIADDVAMRQGRPAHAAKRPSLWSSIGFWRSASFAGAALSALLAIFSGVLIGQMQPRPVAVAVLQSDDQTPGAIIEAFADGSVRLVPLRAIDVPPGRALQIWTLWDRARGPVPLGVMPQAEQRRLARSDGLPMPIDKQLYEITLEPANGSPTGRPTGPILYKGLATVIH